MSKKYSEEKDLDRVLDDPGFIREASEMIMRAGQSKRVWKELYKVCVLYSRLLVLN